MHKRILVFFMPHSVFMVWPVTYFW